MTGDYFCRFAKLCTPLRSENILKRTIPPACERLKLPRVGWHALRHTSAILLHEQEPLRVAQTILGHSDLQTTLGYTHVLHGWQREAMKRLEDVVLFPNVPKSQNEPGRRDLEPVGASRGLVVRPERFELPAFWFVVWQLFPGDSRARHEN
jgi:hypothetical protein